MLTPYIPPEIVNIFMEFDSNETIFPWNRCSYEIAFFIIKHLTLKINIKNQFHLQ